MIGDVANYAKTANDGSGVVVERIIVPFKKPLVAGLRHGKTTIPRNATFARKRFMKMFVFLRFDEERKNFESGLANYVFTLQTGNAFHLTIPDGVIAFPIKRKDAIQTDIEE